MQYPRLQVDTQSVSDDDDPEKKKTKLCRHFARGFCRFGAKCAFAHGEPELRFDMERSTFYKTEVCRFWPGSCKNGAKCRWAHGDHELRPSTPTSSPAPLQSALSNDGGNMHRMQMFSSSGGNVSGPSQDMFASPGHGQHHSQQHRHSAPHALIMPRGSMPPVLPSSVHAAPVTPSSVPASAPAGPNVQKGHSHSVAVPGILPYPQFVLNSGRPAGADRHNNGHANGGASASVQKEISPPAAVAVPANGQRASLPSALSPLYAYSPAWSTGPSPASQAAWGGVDSKQRTVAAFEIVDDATDSGQLAIDELTRHIDNLLHD